MLLSLSHAVSSFEAHSLQPHAFNFMMAANAVSLSAFHSAYGFLLNITTIVSNKTVGRLNPS